MIITEKRKLIAILLFSFLLILGSAVWAYNIGIVCGLKGDAEKVLLLGFIGAGTHIFLSAGLILSANKKKHDFSRLLNTIKESGMLSEKKAKKFGEAGLELHRALAAAHEITMQKSLKIASLNGLVKLLIEMSDAPIFIADLTGEILEASPRAQTETEYSPGALLSDIIPNLSIKEAFKEASVSRLPVTQDENIIFIPVFSTIGEISYFIIDISRQGLLSKVIDKLKIKEGEKRHRLNFL